MNKNDLIRRISEQRTVSIKEATKYVNAVLGAIGDMLAEKESVTIPDFGKFSVRTVPEKTRIVFKPFKRIKAYSFIN